MQERRSMIRRRNDFALLSRVKELEARAEQHSDHHRDESGHARRRVIRHNCSVEISMRVGYSSGNSDLWNVEKVKVAGRLLDLSPAGAALFTSQPYEPNQELQLEFRMGGNAEAIDAKGAIRWVKAVPKKGGYALGVQFTKVSPADQRKISEFLADMDATIGL